MGTPLGRSTRLPLHSWPNRICFDRVQAFDEEQDRTVYFEPSAVAAIRKERSASA